ncbi:MAG: arylesterase [Burkholderiaceae bacterium]
MGMLLPCASAQTPSAGKPPVLLVVGDSLSAEYGIARGKGWVALLQSRLQAQKLPHNVVNASISGETTSGGAQRIDGLIKQHQPAVVVIELGANDALRGLPLEMTERNLARMIEASSKAGAKVLLVGMEMPPNYGAAYTQRFRTMFANLAQKFKIPLVPFFLVKFGTDLSFFQSDRIHPNERGQPLMLDTLWPQLQPLLGAPK